MTHLDELRAWAPDYPWTFSAVQARDALGVPVSKINAMLNKLVKYGIVEKVGSGVKGIKPGDDWRYAITKGINESRGVLACLSKHSIRVPGVCLDELRIAVSERSRTVATVILESPESVSPPLSVAHIAPFDLSAWRSNTDPAIP